MFRHQGPSRSERQNIRLAIYLACVAGYVNSSGFFLLGTFTSHVTGNVGRLANQLVTRQFVEASAALAMLICFFFGAFLASLIVENRAFTRTPTAYGAALTLEAALLIAFALEAKERFEVPDLTLDMEALMLCLAMGVQNSLVTRLSGAVVRTTHLTGVMTDLGIETARWLAWWRSDLRTRLRKSLRPPRERPVVAKIRLHLTIVSAFIVGAVLGCALTTMFHKAAMLLPSAAISIGAVYAFATARDAPLRTSHAPRPHSQPPAGIAR